MCNFTYFGVSILFEIFLDIKQHKSREAQNLEKMYLGGMFEGLPVYEET